MSVADLKHVYFLPAHTFIRPALGVLTEDMLTPAGYMIMPKLNMLTPAGYLIIPQLNVLVPAGYMIIPELNMLIPAGYMR